MPGPTGPQGRTAVVAASVAGHFLERSIDPVDLRGFDDIEFWASGDRIADGTAGRPFFCEVRLGSAAAPIGSGANRWHRYVPVAGPGPPQRVPFGLDDLPAPVRSACSVIRITFPEAPGSVRLTPPAAVRPQLLADTDAALTARLDNRLSLRGAPVRAVLRAEPDQGRPYLLLVNHSIEHALTRVSTGRSEPTSPRPGSQSGRRACPTTSATGSRRWPTAGRTPRRCWSSCWRNWPPARRWRSAARSCRSSGPPRGSGSRTDRAGPRTPSTRSRRACSSPSRP
nr:hypothetical protein GCM10020093_031480 [Planobispora longispora]